VLLGAVILACRLIAGIPTAGTPQSGIFLKIAIVPESAGDSVSNIDEGSLDVI
jgi:hypothetical protein